MRLIPEEIKAIERPEKTEVRLFNGKYYVVPYVSVWNKEKGKPMKRSLPYIATIELVDGEYRIIERKGVFLEDEPEIKEYGNYKFIDQLNKDLLEELANYYGRRDGTKIYVYSLLRLLYGDTNTTLDEEYINSYISVDYPSVAVSKNSILEFIKKLGKHDNANKNFLKTRIKQDNQLLIFDSTQLTNEGSGNAFTEYGMQAKKTKKPQICEIKVYDTVRKEPIYYETIPGNVVDKTAFIQVLNHFDVSNVTIIADRGFNTKENIDYLTTNGIKFLIPLNSNSKELREQVAKNSYTHAFKWEDKSVRAFKVQLKDKFLYVYKDAYIAATKEANYINHITNSKQGYTLEGLDKRSTMFGVIGFYSNLDLEISLPYSYYKERWIIETFIKLEKTSLDNEVIRVHSTPGILGVRFLVQIEMIMLARVYNNLKELEILKISSILQTLKRLSKTYKILKNGRWVTSITTKKNIKFLNQLNVPIA